jgi:hypothetical protein
LFEHPALSEAAAEAIIMSSTSSTLSIGAAITPFELAPSCDDNRCLESKEIHSIKKYFFKSFM